MQTNSIGDLWKLVHNRPAEWRLGQAYWNYACQLFGNDFVERYRIHDPFYNDKNIKYFLQDLYEGLSK